jgi:tetratricopeptide (TPR) repeat protein/predicted Ser/Thr protein kinase
VIDSADQTVDAGDTSSQGRSSADTPAASADALAEPDRGALLGRYVVLSKLGAGAMGVVFAAYDPELDRKVAIKLLRPRPGGDRDAARARLQREAQVLAKLNHENVVSVHDVGVHEGKVFVAMEFVQGQTLARWLAVERRPWQEILAVFEAAGRGLAAAHGEGLVHRDFKPENVMLGDDGRVRVMDFGLARAKEEGQEHDAPEGMQGNVTTRDSLSTELTRTGAIVGTPAYMAPEQFEGAEVTGRSDQFSYCVALFEALYGVRPFSGSTFEQLALSVTEGQVAPAPRAGIPRWLYRMTLRGLSRAPGDRYADMQALLAALSAGETRRRRNGMLLALGVLGVGAAFFFGYQGWDEGRTVNACVAYGDEVDQVWNDERRRELRDGLLATGVEYAQATVDSTMPRFDAQAEAIRHSRTEACLDTRVRRAWTEDLLDRADWCLEERETQLAALARELSRADTESIQQAVTAVERLSQVEPCRDAARLRQSPAPPRDREAVEAASRTLSMARALEWSGKYQDGVAVAKEALGQATDAGWPSLTASSHVTLGSLLELNGEYEGAEATLEEGYFLAADAGATEVEASLATNLVYVVGSARARHEDSLRWGRHAERALRALQEPEDSLRWAALYGRLASAHKTAGAYAEALPLHERTLAIREKTFGRDSIGVATTVNNLANALQAVGEYDRAATLHERALAVREGALGPDHPDVAKSLNNLAELYRATGRYEDAKPLHERSISIREQVLGPDHPMLGTSLGNLALVHLALEEHDEALELQERSLAILETSLGSDHPLLGIALGNLAELQLKMGALEEAKNTYLRALAVDEKALGKEHQDLAFSLNGLAIVALRQGRAADAVSLAHRAVDVRERGEARAELIAESRFTLARSLWETSAGAGEERERALALAEQAHDALRGVAGQEDLFAQVEAFVAAAQTQ